MGVPPMKILIENESRNTGENIRFTYQLLNSLNMLPRKLIIVSKPYMSRRVISTFLKQWPDTGAIQRSDIVIRGPGITLLRYPTDDVGDLASVITVMMGDLQRLDYYFKLGYQTYTFIPSDVRKAYELLYLSKMYNAHLVN